MINDIVEAIRMALGMEFGDGYEIHTEETGQQPDKPTFFIECQSGAVRPSSGGRYYARHRFRIRYLPISAQKWQGCNDVADRMSWCLEELPFKGDRIRGNEMRYEASQGILNFYVDYECCLCRGDEDVPMEHMESQTKGR